MDEWVQIGVVVASDLEPDSENGQSVVPIAAFVQRGLHRGAVFVIEVNEMHLHRVGNLSWEENVPSMYILLASEPNMEYESNAILLLGKACIAMSILSLKEEK